MKKENEAKLDTLLEEINDMVFTRLGKFRHEVHDDINILSDERHEIGQIVCCGLLDIAVRYFANSVNAKHSKETDELTIALAKAFYSTLYKSFVGL